MPNSVTFRNKILTIPGSYSDIDFSALTNIPIGSFGIITILTTSDKADPNKVMTFTDPNSIKTYYGNSSRVSELADLIFHPSNDTRIGSPNFVNVVIVNNPTKAIYDDSYFTFTSKSFGPTGNYTKFNYNINTSSSIDLSITDTISSTTNSYSISQEAGSIDYNSISPITISKSNTTLTINSNTYDATKLNIAGFSNFLSGLLPDLSFTIKTSYIGNTIDTLDDFSLSLSNTSSNPVYLNVWYLNNKFNDPFISIKVKVPNLTESNIVSTSSMLINGNTHTDSNNLSSTTILQSDINRAMNLLNRTYTNTLCITADSQNNVDMGLGLVYSDITELLTSLKSEVDGRNSLYEGNYTSLVLGYNSTSIDDIITFQQSINDPAISIVTQNIINPYTNKTVSPYGLSIIIASLGASLPLGTSLTRKNINVLDATFPFSYILNRENKTKLIQNGILFLDKSSGGNIYIVKGNTSYTQQDNDAYVDIGTQLLSQYLLYDFNNYISSLIGQDISSVNPSAPRIAPLVNPSSFQQAAIEKFVDWETQGYITPITDTTGKILVPAYSNIIVNISNKTVNFQASVILVSGVEFILSLIKALPYSV